MPGENLLAQLKAVVDPLTIFGRSYLLRIQAIVIKLSALSIPKKLRLSTLLQSQTMIPIVEGFLLLGQSLWLDLRYRPFAATEDFDIEFAPIGEQKVYVRTKEEGVVRFTLRGTDFAQLILSRLTELDRKNESARVQFESINGETSKLCYCETVKTYVDYLPASLCKEWDSGSTAKFRVGGNQEGMGPDPRPAGWKLLDQYPVYYGDGMYTHGEFVDISPNLASAFTQRIHDKYFIKKVSYYFTEHYYDLEPMP